MFVRYFLIICLMPACLSAHAQSSLSRHFPRPVGTVYSILQDSKGFMWFGTSNGLVRYDGHAFTTYTHKPADSTSLSDSFIIEIIEDHQGFLWVSTLNAGLNRFNPATGKSDRLADIIRDEDFRKVKRFSALSLAPDGTVWVGSENLHRIHPQQFTVEKFKPLPNSNVISIYFSDNRWVWLGTNGDGFGKFDATLQKFEQLTVSHNDPVINERANVVRSITADQNGNIWLGTYGGLVCYNPQTKVWQHYTHVPDDAGSLPHNSIWNVIADYDNKLWISTWGGGITFLDTETGKFKNEYFRPGGLMGIEAKEVPGLFLDENGMVWAGTNARGIYQVDFPKEVQQFPVPFKIPQKIQWITRLRNWSCLISEAEGVYLFKTGSPEFFHLHYAGKPGKLTLSGNRVAAVWELKNGTVYFGTENGLTAFTPSTQKITYYRREPGNPAALPHNDVMALAADDDDRLWVGTPFGLSRLNDDHLTFTQISNKIVPATSVTALAIAGSHLAAGTATQGLFIINQISGKATSVNSHSGLSSNYVRGLCFDNSGLLWAATSEGVNALTTDGIVIHKPAILSGAIGSQIYTTPEGVLTVSDKGYFLVNPDGTTKKTGIYDFGDVPSFYFINTTRVIFNLPSGLYALPLLTPVPETTSTPVLLTRFELSANNPNPLPNDEAIIHPAYRNSIVLNYNQNFFSFEFSLLDYKQPEQHLYAYRLTGFDHDWIYNNNRQFASYTNIPPGTYVLQLQACDAYGIWHVNAAALTVTILPPWWKTSWAYAGYALLFTALLWFARKQIVNLERLKAQVAMEQKEKQTLRELDHLKTKFFSNITHEFRTPLTLIQGPAEQLLEKTTDKEAVRQLNLIKNNAQRLLKLINQLLDLAKLDANEAKLDVKPLDLAALCRSAIVQFTSLAESRNINFQWQLTEPLPNVLGDAEKIETILINLISNAMKFTPSGGQVKVSAQFQENKFSFTVEDTGRGIPASKLEHIFDRFYQVEASDSSHAEGTGIGLALVKEYTELMRGIIHVESTPGKGTVFTVTLPLQPSTMPVVAETEKPDKPVNQPATTQSGEIEHLPLLLLVEDNEDIRTLIKSCLGSTYRYSEARHGKEGLEKARKEIPDMIISDLMMPEMDGLEFCKRIKNDPHTNHIPFIMLTAKAADEHKLTGLQTGADDYLIKPFNKEELIFKVQNLVRLREKLQEHIKLNLLTKATPVKAVSASEQFIMKAKTFVEANMGDASLSVERLASELNLGREQCYRKMMAITGLSPSAFIRKLKLQRAAQLLAAKAAPVSQVAYQVGYENLSHFSKAFKEEFGQLPSEYTG